MVKDGGTRLTWIANHELETFRLSLSRCKAVTMLRKDILLPTEKIYYYENLQP